MDVGQMDDLGRLDSPVHRADARVKLLVTLVFVVVVMSFPRYEVSALVPLFAYPIVLAAQAGLPPGYLLRKMALAAPFALFVGVFNPLLDRHPAAVLGSHGIAGGWLSFASIMIRFTLTVGAALVLLACTGIHRLCAGMERLGVPKVFAVQVLFLYRYFFVVGDEANRMARAVGMRAAGPGSLSPRTYGTLLGHLLLRAMDRARRVYRAMVARGFDGEVRVLRGGAPGWREAVFATGWVAFFAAARHWNLAEVVGRWLIRSGA